MLFQVVLVDVANSVALIDLHVFISKLEKGSDMLICDDEMLQGEYEVMNEYFLNV